MIQIITRIRYWKDDFATWLLQSERHWCLWQELFENAKIEGESIDRFRSPCPHIRTNLQYTLEKKKMKKN